MFYRLYMSICTSFFPVKFWQTIVYVFIVAVNVAMNVMINSDNKEYTKLKYLFV